MASTDPPSFTSSVFNTEAFNHGDGFISLDYANKTYYKQSGGPIFGSVSIGGTALVSSSTSATSKTTGALIVTGGVGIGGDLYVTNVSAGNLTISGSVSGVTTLSASGVVTLTNSSISSTTTTGALVVTGGVGIGGSINIGGSLTLNGSVSGVTTFGSSGIMTLSNATVSSSTSTGALVVTGGVGVGGMSYFGGGMFCTSGGDIITFSNTTSSARLTLRFINDARSWEFGTRGSAATNANSMYIYDNTASSYRLLINASGFVGIGTTSPSCTLTIQRTNTNPYIRWTDGTIIGETYISTTGVAIGTNTNHPLALYTNNGTQNQLYLDASVNKYVGINTSSPAYTLHVNGTCNISSSFYLGGVQLAATAAEMNYLSGVTAGVAAASKALILDSSKNIYNINQLTLGLAVGSITSNARLVINPSNNAFAEILYMSNGLVDAVMNLKTTSLALGTVTPVGGTPAALELVTNNTIRLKINGSGNVGIATTSPSYDLDVNGVLRSTQLLVGTSTDTARLISALDSAMVVNDVRYITLGRSATFGNQAEISFGYAGDNSDDNRLNFGFYGGERVKLTKWGSFVINTATSSYGGYRSRLVVASAAAIEWGSVFQNTSNSNNKTIMFADNSGTEKGSITFGTGTTSFNTTSDYRLKKDIVPIRDGLDLVKRLNPVRFKWKGTNIDGEGFIAHELQEVDAHCVVGEKDAVYVDGSINPQAVDYGKLTPILVNAIQELERRLRALEGKQPPQDVAIIDEERDYETIRMRGKKIKIKKYN